MPIHPSRNNVAVTHYEVLEECTDRSVVRLTLEFLAPVPEDIKRCIEEGRRKNAEASAAARNHKEAY